jgi:N-acetylneuraminate synthase
MSIHIAGRPIGPEQPPYIIAELSGNHNGDLQRALALIDVAVDAGADAVKLQTYTADTITIDHDGPLFRIQGGPWDGRRLHELYAEASTPWAWHEALFAHAAERGITCFSSPFDPTAVDFLAALGAPAYKVASFELVDLPLIEKMAQQGKPMIMSTGMAAEDEVLEGVAAARGAGCTELIVLHCNSGYPSPVSDIRLATIPRLRALTGAQVGLSDHTLGTTASVAAVALGATVIEKHITLRRADGGPDAGFSLEPAELAELVRACREAWEAIGTPRAGLSGSEAGNRIFRRSLFVVADVEAGEALSPANLRSIRPGYGLPPKLYPALLGRRAKVKIPRGTPLSMDLLEGG